MQGLEAKIGNCFSFTRLNLILIKAVMSSYILQSSLPLASPLPLRTDLLKGFNITFGRRRRHRRRRRRLSQTCT